MSDISVNRDPIETGLFKGKPIDFRPAPSGDPKKFTLAAAQEEPKSPIEKLTAPSEEATQNLKSPIASAARHVTG
jgi:hypothetical protein